MKNKVDHDPSAVIDDAKQHSIDMFSNIVDKSKDPQYYVDRYNNEPEYKKWFDANFVEITIYEALGIKESDLESIIDPEPGIDPEPVTKSKELGIAMFVDQTKDPQYYVDRYNNEPEYKKWFDDNYSKYPSIYDAVGLENSGEEPISELKIGECGSGTELVDGMCIVIEKSKVKPWWQFW